MKILVVGAFDSWMGLHLDHVCAGLTAAGFQVVPANYHRMQNRFGLPLPEKLKDELRQRGLEKAVMRHRPDICFFPGSCKFDLARLKSYWNGVAVFHDYDGPRRNSAGDFFRICDHALFLTVSRCMEREMKKAGREAFYLPHGVDTDYYSPAGADDGRFYAECSFIGRATSRRIAVCSRVPCGLALYGERWKNTALSDCCRLRRDVRGKELVGIYRNSDIMLNVLQEPLDEYRTILSLQCFAVPSSGGCLCAEYVEELPEAFEEGREVLAFRHPDELPELISRTIMDRKLVSAIRDAGRKRCLAEHTHFHRAKKLRDLLS